MSLFWIVTISISAFFVVVAWLIGLPLYRRFLTKYAKSHDGFPDHHYFFGTSSGMHLLATGIETSVAVIVASPFLMFAMRTGPKPLIWVALSTIVFDLMVVPIALHMVLTIKAKQYQAKYGGDDEPFKTRTVSPGYIGKWYLAPIAVLCSNDWKRWYSRKFRTMSGFDRGRREYYTRNYDALLENIVDAHPLRLILNLFHWRRQVLKSHRLELDLEQQSRRRAR